MPDHWRQLHNRSASGQSPPRLHRGALSVSLLRRRIGADALQSNCAACVAVALSTGRSARSGPEPGLLWNATANVLINL